MKHITKAISKNIKEKVDFICRTLFVLSKFSFWYDVIDWLFVLVIIHTDLLMFIIPTLFYKIRKLKRKRDLNDFYLLQWELHRLGIFGSNATEFCSIHMSL